MFDYQEAFQVVVLQSPFFPQSVLECCVRKKASMLKYLQDSKLLFNQNVAKNLPRFHFKNMDYVLKRRLIQIFSPKVCLTAFNSSKYFKKLIKNRPQVLLAEKVSIKPCVPFNKQSEFRTVWVVRNCVVKVFDILYFAHPPERSVYGMIMPSPKILLRSIVPRTATIDIIENVKNFGTFQIPNFRSYWTTEKFHLLLRRLSRVDNLKTVIFDRMEPELKWETSFLSHKFKNDLKIIIDGQKNLIVDYQKLRQLLSTKRFVIDLTKQLNSTNLVARGQLLQYFVPVDSETNFKLTLQVPVVYDFHYAIKRQFYDLKPRFFGISIPFWKHFHVLNKKERESDVKITN